MAEIYTVCGRYDEALDELDYALSLGLGATVNDLKLASWTKPLSALPRYQALLERYALVPGT